MVPFGSCVISLGPFGQVRRLPTAEVPKGTPTKSPREHAQVPGDRGVIDGADPGARANGWNGPLGSLKVRSGDGGGGGDDRGLAMRPAAVDVMLTLSP